MKKLALLFLMFLGITVFHNDANAQNPNLCKDGRNPVTGEPCTNVIITSVPFLRINPDARSGAMGDAGLATSTDPNALHFNASKLAFAENPIAISATYTPWLRAIGLNDVYLAYLTGYYKLDKLQSIGLGLRFFSMGEINFTNTEGESLGNGKPQEFEINGAYARKLTEKFAVAVGGKFIYSNLAAGQSLNGIDIKAGKVGAADISMTYKTPLSLGNTSSNLSVGLAFTNMGTKITYTNSADKDFIPANVGLGAGWEFKFDEFNKLGVFLDFNKLMVPTPGSGHDDDTAISGMFASFGDASGKEELKEVMTSFGVEYWYDDQFAVRAGYFGENKLKGNRKYFTAGLGLKYSVFGLDLSYLIPSGPVQTNPLANTLRFTLSYLFDNNLGEDVPK
ncbi:MAG TPA: type IX secretion system outer membrane channel protein PorV [Saprospiraceae bacterium]|nr:type IX secretion system outer membrane channel protein PorV [Saprospiraceae bacterium]